MKIRTLLTTAVAGLTLGTMGLIGAPQAIARDHGDRDDERQESRHNNRNSDSYSRNSDSYGRNSDSYGWNSDPYGGNWSGYGQERGQRQRDSFRGKSKHNRGRHRGWYKSNGRGHQNNRWQDRDQDGDRR
ncbi:MAG TPA: hypothetical protein VGM51_05520 [Armatimonadota bacterium]|jgi:hypothetical protein